MRAQREPLPRRQYRQAAVGQQRRGSIQQAAPEARLKQLLVGSLIASLCAAATVAIAAILSESEIDETTARILGTVAALTIYSLTGLASNSLRPRRPELRRLGDLGLLSSLAGFAVAMAAIWIDEDSDSAWRAEGVALTITFALAHSALLLRSPDARLGDVSRRLRVATVAVTSVLAGLLVVQILASDGAALDWRLIAVVAVLFLLGNVLLPLFRLLEPKHEGGARGGLRLPPHARA
jgi:hypothetical protein